MYSFSFSPQAWGPDFREWSKENLMDAGTILAALSPSELGDLWSADLDVLESLGDYEIFTQEQVNRTVFLYQC